MQSHLLGFIALSALTICTPGPDTALTIRNSLAGGRQGGVFTGIGVAIGLLIWTGATSIGVIGILVASARAFELLKLVGAAYLIYLGLQSLHGALRRSEAHEARGATGAVTRFGALRQGLANDLANPKIAAFFPSLLPQFVSGHSGVGFQVLLLGVLFSAMTLLWLTLYAVLIGRLRAWFQRDRVRRALDAISGTVLIAFGVRLAASST